MEIEEILRSIDSKDVEFIQRIVKVDYDNRLQIPLKFFYQRREHRIKEVLGTFKGDLSPKDLAFLVRTEDGDVYLLYLHFFDSLFQTPLSPSWWILSYRVLRDEELMFLYREEKKMIVNMQLKKIADFHGHLCPDLVIGCRACEMALEILSQREEIRGGLTVIAENTTSSLDAIQCITGCTLGNQRLVIYDFGKHNYTFMMKQNNFAIKLSLKEQHFGDEKIYFSLEDKIIKEEATLEDVAQFQRLIDGRVKALISLKPDELFEVMETRRRPPKTELPTVYLRCSHCGDLVLKAKLVKMEGLFICRPCFDQLIHIPSNAN
jgi:formylmethanofuran dehydrogenase subunit E